MLTDVERAYLARATRTMQALVGALAGGVVSFFVVTLVVGPLNAGPPGQPFQPLLTYISIAGAFASLFLAIVISTVIVRKQRQAMVVGKPILNAGAVDASASSEVERELGPLVTGYQTVLIIRSALLEGAAFFCLMTFMIERQTLSLVGAGMMLLFILAGFPTRSKVEEAVESERVTIAQLRQMEPNDAR